jgi:hypothetical protein
MKDFMVEFRSPEEIVAAAQRLREAGYEDVEAYTPFPVEGLDGVLGIGDTPLGWIGLIGGIVGGVGFFAMEVYATVFSYRENIGGRPPLSWPFYLLPAFPVLIIGAALAILAGFVILNRFPRLHHPVFGVEGFERATQDRFFLRVQTGEDAAAEALLRELNPLAVRDVPS